MIERSLAPFLAGTTLSRTDAKDLESDKGPLLKNNERSFRSAWRLVPDPLASRNFWSALCSIGGRSLPRDSAMSKYWTLVLAGALCGVAYYVYNSGSYLGYLIQRLVDPLLRFGRAITNAIFGV